MRLTELLKTDQVTISCELFPPKQGAQLANYKNIVADMAALKPAYMSVTYGATGGACYPEGHPEADTIFEDLDHLKEKVDAGCEFLTTQMFFDNHILYNFLYKALSRGIDVPVVAGIMPVTNKAQIKRIVSLSGNMVPPRFLAIVDRFGDNPAAMRQAGIAYATDQIIDLIANGVNHVHIYTMNKPDVAGEILDNLSEIYVRA